MDYSSSIHEAEHPAGASPWDNSLEHNRSTFSSTLTSDFSSVIASNGLHAPEDEGGFGADDLGFERPDTATGLSATDTIETTEIRLDDGHEGQGLPTGDQAPSPGPHDFQGTPKVHANQQQTGSRRPMQPQLKLQTKITGLERTGRKDPILRFDVHTNLPAFRTTQYRDVRRLHSEFVKLAEHLISANPEAIVPAVPPALTSAGAGTDEDEARVKALMQRWLNFVSCNDILIRDDEMVLFVESDFGYSPMVRKKQPATGVRRKILKQFAPPPDDTPELKEARPMVKLFYLGTMDAGHKVDKLVKSRRGLGLAESDFGTKMSVMHVQELHQGLANAYRKLGKIIQTVGDCHAAQATAEATTIGDPFQYHSQDAFIVKETLTNRQILIRELIQAQELSRSKLGAADRLRSSTNVRREKVDEAIAALDEARRNEGYLYQKTTRVTQNLVFERRKWFARTAAELRLGMREYVLREIEAERRTLALLESVRPDIRTIDASGGLSRLGRESHPAVRRASLAASQGPKGDAWSGVPRRSDSLRGSVAGPGGLITSPGVVAGMTTAGSVGGEDEDDVEGEDPVNARTLAGAKVPGVLPGLAEEDDEDRVDARNAARWLATSTF